MRVHHLNCGTMCPLLGKSFNLQGTMVCHCLLIETENGLVLVDTGFGRADIADPGRHLGASFMRTTRPQLKASETAWAQVQALGFAVEDVRHVVLTHLDLDHAGGLADFPRAKVHVHAPELVAAEARLTYFERQRYQPLQWAHNPEWVRHEVHGERWHGFDCVSSLPGLPEEILLVPLRGHTRGHSGIAVRAEEGWLLHCGDAYFSHHEIKAKPSCPLALRAFQSLMQMDGPARHANQTRLRELHREHPEVRLFCAHDPEEMS